MKKILVLLLVLCPVILFSEENPGARTSLFVKLGNSYPISGHWADSDAGFKRSGNYKLMIIKDLDENVSYGLQTGSSPKYSNKGTDLDLKIFSFTPTFFSWLGAPRHRYFVYGGTGVYHWSQPASVLYGSDSGTQFGYNLGAGVLYDFLFELRWGLSLEWNHIFNMKGDNFDLDSANNFDVNVVFCKRW